MSKEYDEREKKLQDSLIKSNALGNVDRVQAAGMGYFYGSREQYEIDLKSADDALCYSCMKTRRECIIRDENCKRKKEFMTFFKEHSQL